MAYQYLQALPQIAAGASNKIWIVPAELTKALEGISGAFGGLRLGPEPDADAQVPGGPLAPEAAKEALAAAEEAANSAAQAAAVAAAETGDPRGLPAAATKTPSVPPAPAEDPKPEHA